MFLCARSHATNFEPPAPYPDRFSHTRILHTSQAIKVTLPHIFGGRYGIFSLIFPTKRYDAKGGDRARVSREGRLVLWLDCIFSKQIIWLRARAPHSGQFDGATMEGRGGRGRGTYYSVHTASTAQLSETLKRLFIDSR